MPTYALRILKTLCLIAASLSCTAANSIQADCKPLTDGTVTSNKPVCGQDDLDDQRRGQWIDRIAAMDAITTSTREDHNLRLNISTNIRRGWWLCEEDSCGVQRRAQYRAELHVCERDWKECVQTRIWTLPLTVQVDTAVIDGIRTTTIERPYPSGNHYKLYVTRDGHHDDRPIVKFIAMKGEDLSDALERNEDRKDYELGKGDEGDIGTVPGGSDSNEDPKDHDSGSGDEVDNGAAHGGFRLSVMVWVGITLCMV